MNEMIETLMRELQHAHSTSTNTLVQSKAEKALAKLKTARTLIEQAQRTNGWIQREMNPRFVIMFPETFGYVVEAGDTGFRRTQHKSFATSFATEQAAREFCTARGIFVYSVVAK